MSDVTDMKAELLLLRKENKELRDQNAKLLKLLEDMKDAPCCGDYCWMELPQRLRDAGIEVPS